MITEQTDTRIVLERKGRQIVAEKNAEGYIAIKERDYDEENGIWVEAEMCLDHDELNSLARWV